MGIHALFDVAAWLVALGALMVLRRSWFRANPVAQPMRWGYTAAVIFGAGLGAWILGTANLRLSGIPEFGRSIEGALVGAILSVELYKWQTGIAARTGAIYALPAALGIAVGRIGCQLSGLEDNTYGIPTGGTWGWDHGDGINRHPVAFYESGLMVAFVCLYLTMMAAGSTRWRDNGFYYFLVTYAVGRFGLEYLKPYATLLPGLGIFQLTSILLALYAVVMIRTNREWLPLQQRP